MKIQLLDISGIKAVEKAAMMPYDTKTENPSALAYRVWKAGHRSITRHAMISFEVKGISQDALRQLSRHPHINLTVKSTRYCDMTNAMPFIPKWIDDSLELKKKYIEDYSKAMYNYDEWYETEHGMNEEDTAKLMLPLASTTDLIMSGNIQAMYEFLMLRNCVRASEEIRNMSQKMTGLLMVESGLIGRIFLELDCKGKEYGYCPEHKKCGKY